MDLRPRSPRLICAWRAVALGTAVDSSERPDEAVIQLTQEHIEQHRQQFGRDANFQPLSYFDATLAVLRDPVNAAVAERYKLADWGE